MSMVVNQAIKGCYKGAIKQLRRVILNSRNVYKTFQLEDQVIKNLLEYNQAIKVIIRRSKILTWLQFCRPYVSDNPLIIQPSLSGVRMHLDLGGGHRGLICIAKKLVPVENYKKWDDPQFQCLCLVQIKSLNCLPHVKLLFP